MEQTKALNALEPFLALSKSATSPRAAADLITRATSAPNTYIFTELLQTPQVQALASSDEYAPYLTLLQIFSYGTYSSYTSTTGLPALSDAQRLKLRQLALLTLARKDDDTPDDASSPALGYAALQQALDLPSRQALEELVISAIYAGLIKAQLNPKDSLVQINSVAPLRDVAPTATGGLLSSLQSWAGRCDATLESLSCQMAQLRADADQRAARAAARTDEARRLVEIEQKGGNPPTLPSYISGAIAAGRSPIANGRGAIPRPSTTTTTTTTTTHHQGGSTARTNKMNSVLTVGGGSSFPTPTLGAPSAGPLPPSTIPASSLQVKPAVKRGSGQMGGQTDGHAGDSSDVGGEGALGEVDGEDDGPDGEKRASKRKLNVGE